MPYDKYGLSAPKQSKTVPAPPKPDAAAPAPPKPLPGASAQAPPKPDAPSASKPESKPEPKPVSDPKASSPAQAAPAKPAPADSAKPGDSKPEDKPKVVAPPKDKPEDKAAAAPSDKPNLDGPPAKPEDAPEKPAPKEAEDEDEDEVEWPEIPGESDTKYGLPDYSNGYEGEDAANIPDQEPSTEDSDNYSDDESSRHNTEINIYYLVAGQSLFEHDTVSKAYPHAPAVAKPFHILDDFKCADGHDCGVQTVFEPESLSMWCVFGKDGTENDYDLNRATIDNTGCFAHELFYNFQTLTFSAKNNGSGYMYSAPLIWSLAMIAFGFLTAMTFFLCRLYLRRSHYKNLSNPPAKAELNEGDAQPLSDDLETEQLTATTHNRYDGSS